MSEGGPGAPSEEHKCPEGKIWDEASGACITATEVEDKNVGATAGVQAELGLTQRIQRTVEAYFAELEKKLDKKFDEKLATLMKTKEAEVESALRKSLGIEKDPVIHLSDLHNFSRKIQLETSKSGKRSPATSDIGVGPEGNTTEDTNKPAHSKAIDSLMKEYNFVKGDAKA